MIPLYKNMMVPCHMMDKTSVSGPTGIHYKWTQGAAFMAAVVKDKTLQARVAEKEGVTSVYTVTTLPEVGLDFHEVFRRDKDGATFRVTSESAGSQPPEIASFSFQQVSAERWELPE